MAENIENYKKIYLYGLFAIVLQLLFNFFLLVLMNHLDSNLSWDLIKNRYSLWDGHHYLELAEYGYTNIGERGLYIVFLPLYPALIKLLSDITHSYFIAGWLISNGMSAVGHVFLYKTLKIWGFTRAMRIFSVLFILLSPPALYLCVIYTEGLFYGLLCIFFFCLAKKEYLLAALFGLLLSLTRQTGLVLVLSYLTVLFLDWRHLNRATWIKNSIFTGFIPAGYMFYLALNKSLYDNFFYYTYVLKSHWHKEMRNPFVQYWSNLKDFKWQYPSLNENYMYYQDNFWLLIFPIFLFAPLVLKLKIPKHFLIWGAGSYLIFLSQSFWLSSTRYIWMTLVIQLVLVALAKGHRIFIFVIIVKLIELSFSAWYFFSKGGWVF